MNYVETSPESPQALIGDIHEDSPEARKQLAAPVPAVAGENTGWTSSGGSGPMTSVELIETGPLRGRLRLGRSGETWEFTWTAGSAALRWRARRGFRFTAVSASPYVPFDRFVDGSEYDWPSGPGSGEPGNHDIAPRNWTALPGGHAVYYQLAENYGALGIVALDAELKWTGIGSRRFTGEKADGDAGIALTFPQWRGEETVLEARKENRLVRQPLLVEVSGPDEAALRVNEPAAREPVYVVELQPAVPAPFTPEVLPLDGQWELAWAEKGAGPPEAGWRTVKVPGSAHTQWLDAAKIYTRDAEWVSYKEWWYRRRFRVPASFAGKRLRLQFDATDYYADTYVKYYGWYGGSIWQYTRLTQRFVSELGATALPNYSTLVKFMPDQWPIKDHAAEWTWRRLQIREALRAWGDPGTMTLEQYVPKTQAYVSRLFQIALERMRRRKSEGAGGVLHFHAIDIWPSVTMAAIDFERVPTKVFDTVRRSFAPVAASIEYDRDRWQAGEPFRCSIWAINDSWEEIPDAKIAWRIVDSTAKVHASGEWPAAMAADSSRKIGEVTWTAARPGAHELRAEVRAANGSQISENVFEFEVVKENR